MDWEKISTPIPSSQRLGQVGELRTRELSLTHTNYNTWESRTCTHQGSTTEPNLLEQVRVSQSRNREHGTAAPIIHVHYGSVDRGELPSAHQCLKQVREMALWL